MPEVPAEDSAVTAHPAYRAAVRDLPWRTRARWWLDRRDNFTVWNVGNLLLCWTTGHVWIENVNVRSKWATHCAWCQKPGQPR